MLSPNFLSKNINYYRLIFKLNLEMASKRKVNVSDYDLLQTMVTGLFGRIRLAKEKATGKYYALKILKKHDIIKLKQVDHVMNEMHMFINFCEIPFWNDFQEFIDYDLACLALSAYAGT